MLKILAVEDLALRDPSGSDDERIVERKSAASCQNNSALMAFDVDGMDCSGERADRLQSLFDLVPAESEFLVGDIRKFIQHLNAQVRSLGEKIFCDRRSSIVCESI